MLAACPAEDGIWHLVCQGYTFHTSISKVSSLSAKVLPPDYRLRCAALKVCLNYCAGEEEKIRGGCHRRSSKRREEEEKEEEEGRGDCRRVRQATTRWIASASSQNRNSTPEPYWFLGFALVVHKVSLDTSNQYWPLPARSSFPNRWMCNNRSSWGRQFMQSMLPVSHCCSTFETSVNIRNVERTWEYESSRKITHFHYHEWEFSLSYIKYTQHDCAICAARKLASKWFASQF